jgi:hypothetical protein
MPPPEKIPLKKYSVAVVENHHLSCNWDEMKHHKMQSPLMPLKNSLWLIKAVGFPIRQVSGLKREGSG